MKGFPRSHAGHNGRAETEAVSVDDFLPEILDV